VTVAFAARLSRKLGPKGLYDVAASPEGRRSPKKELLKSISSPLGDGAPFPRATTTLSVIGKGVTRIERLSR